MHRATPVVHGAAVTGGVCDAKALELLAHGVDGTVEAPQVADWEPQDQEENLIGTRWAKKIVFSLDTSEHLGTNPLYCREFGRHRKA